LYSIVFDQLKLLVNGNDVEALWNSIKEGVNFIIVEWMILKRDDSKI
jgi:hypothetical protein